MTEERFAERPEIAVFSIFPFWPGIEHFRVQTFFFLHFFAEATSALSYDVRHCQIQGGGGQGGSAPPPGLRFSVVMTFIDVHS